VICQRGEDLPFSWIGNKMPKGRSATFTEGEAAMPASRLPVTRASRRKAITGFTKSNTMVIAAKCCSSEGRHAYSPAMDTIGATAIPLWFAPLPISAANRQLSMARTAPVSLISRHYSPPCQGYSFLDCALLDRYSLDLKQASLPETYATDMWCSSCWHLMSAVVAWRSVLLPTRCFTPTVS
jgi:hypothetical protein